MAYEIQNGAYLCVEPLNLSFAEEEKDLEDTLPGVQFNFQHDLESLWWLLLWVVTQGVEHPESQQFAKTVFSNQSRPSMARTHVFTSPGYLQTCLAKFLHPSIKDLGHSFVVALDLLRTSYIKRNKPSVIESYSTIHQNIHAFLKTLKSKLSSPVTLQLRSHQSVNPSNTLPRRVKRRHSDADYGDVTNPRKRNC